MPKSVVENTLDLCGEQWRRLISAWYKQSGRAARSLIEKTRERETQKNSPLITANSGGHAAPSGAARVGWGQRNHCGLREEPFWSDEGRKQTRMGTTVKGSLNGKRRRGDRPPIWTKCPRERQCLSTQVWSAQQPSQNCVQPSTALNTGQQALCNGPAVDQQWHLLGPQRPSSSSSC